MQVNFTKWSSFAGLALPALLLSACDPAHFPVYNMTDCPIAATVRYSDGQVYPGLLRPKTRMAWMGGPIVTDISDIKIEDSFGQKFDFPRDALFRLTNQTSIDAEFGFNGRDLQLMKSEDERSYKEAGDFMSLPAEYPSCHR